DQERHFEGRRRALVWHRGDADDDPAAREGVERVAKLESRLRGVEVMRLLGEKWDLVRGDSRSGRQHEVVVRDDRAALEDDRAGGHVDSDRSINDETDGSVEQAALGPREALLAFAAHRDVHEPGLVDVSALRVDKRDGDLAGRDPGAEPTGQQVRGERAADAAAEDDDAVHRHHRAFWTTISSYPSRASSETSRWPAF